MWTILKVMPNRCRYWFQQDGERTSNLSLEWLQEKFGNCIISGNTDIIWPARRPEKTLCDYHLWGISYAEIQKVKSGRAQRGSEWCVSKRPSN